MSDKLTHFLFPSTIFVSDTPHLVTTILGSCVSVCLWDPVSKIGGINHYMLPLWNGEGLASPKYGNIAIAKLVDRMIQQGSKKEHLVAKVFGGAEQLLFEKGSFHIGKRNIAQAREVLNKEKIEVISHHVGGPEGRHIKFHTDTGEVLLKKVKKINIEALSIVTNE